MLCQNYRELEQILEPYWRILAAEEFLVYIIMKACSVAEAHLVDDIWKPTAKKVQDVFFFKIYPECCIVFFHVSVILVPHGVHDVGVGHQDLYGGNSSCTW